MAEVFVPVPSAFQSFTTAGDTGRVTLRTLSPIQGLVPDEGTTTTTDTYALADVIATSITPSYTFPFAPTDIQITGLGDRYETLQRPGRKPLVQYSSSDPVSVAFKVLIVADPDERSQGRGFASAESAVSFLSEIAKAKTDVVLVGFGEIISSYAFRITEFAVASHRMNPNQEMSMVDISLTFTESIRSVDEVPVPGMIIIKDITIAPNAAAKKPGSKPVRTLRWSTVALAKLLGLNAATLSSTALTIMLGRSPTTAEKARALGIDIEGVIAFTKAREAEARRTAAQRALSGTGVVN